MWVYKLSERWTDEHGMSHRLYTVGFYTPSGDWHPESDHESREAAAARCNYLNGGHGAKGGR